MSDQIFVLGRNEIGTVAEDRSLAKPMRYYLTPCCGASSKGMENGVGCRACYKKVDWRLGDVPDADLLFIGGKIEVVRKPMNLIEVFGDGLPYDQWKERQLA